MKPTLGKINLISLVNHYEFNHQYFIWPKDIVNTVANVVYIYQDLPSRSHTLTLDEPISITHPSNLIQYSNCTNEEQLRLKLDSIFDDSTIFVIPLKKKLWKYTTWTTRFTDGWDVELARPTLDSNTITSIKIIKH